MAEVHTHVDIEAPAERVWQILTDLSDYPDWNPLVCQASGDVHEGAELTMSIQPPGADRKSKSATVTVVKPEQELRWVDRAGPPGLLECEWVFKIERLGPEQSRFVQWKVFHGVLGSLWSMRSEEATRAGFEAMNQALKMRAERQASAVGHGHDRGHQSNGREVGALAQASRGA